LKEMMNRHEIYSNKKPPPPPKKEALKNTKTKNN
jgi:hypothetical protein